MRRLIFRLIHLIMSFIHLNVVPSICYIVKESLAKGFLTRLSTQTKVLSGPVRRPGKERTGRPFKVDQDTVEKMIKSLEGHYKQRIKSWDDLAREFGYDAEERPFATLLTGRTVKHYLNETLYHKCRACQKSWINQNQADNRKFFCKAHRKWPLCKWGVVHFSDECHFHQNSRHTDWVIRDKHEGFHPDCIQKRRQTAASQFSAWAMVAVGYKSPLILYQKTEEVDKSSKMEK